VPLDFASAPEAVAAGIAPRVPELLSEISGIGTIGEPVDAFVDHRLEDKLRLRCFVMATMRSTRLSFL